MTKGTASHGHNQLENARALRVPEKSGADFRYANVPSDLVHSSPRNNTDSVLPVFCSVFLHNLEKNSLSERATVPRTS